MVYFLIGTQIIKGGEEKTLQEITNQVSGASSYCKQIVLEKEKFKFGNLDSLMHINDQMIKLENNMEGLLKKIERQYLDITEKAKHEFRVKGNDGECGLDEFTQKFRWDDGKFPKINLPDLLKNLSQKMHLCEHSIRQKTNAYQEAKNAASQISKKEGNLVTRDLVDILKPPTAEARDFWNTENILSLIVIVPMGQEKEFLKNYESFTENVIPGSAKRFNYVDKDQLSLWRVGILKIPLYKQAQYAEEDEGDDQKKKDQKKELSPKDLFIQKAREKMKLTVREFSFIPNESENREKQRLTLDTNEKTSTGHLKEECENQFSELYLTYIHLKHLRFLVDSVMRFGIGEKTLNVLIQPQFGKEKKVTTGLLKIFSDPSQIGLYGTKEELEDTEDFFPFIYIPINV